MASEKDTVRLAEDDDDPWKTAQLAVLLGRGKLMALTARVVVVRVSGTSPVVSQSPIRQTPTTTSRMRMTGTSHDGS